ncbi:hypothetical protein OUZ56_002077 [Daphnia magna]|uniref:Uncharacterized protein n=1 Tax=Daphnia magna TaxID=35525 RepID=A0ABR0A4L4_9CRUS|nr:hypothetical protein OUZ56_002077 [Daphnia magna]
MVGRKVTQALMAAAFSKVLDIIFQGDRNVFPITYCRAMPVAFSLRSSTVCAARNCVFDWF